MSKKSTREKLELAISTGLLPAEVAKPAANILKGFDTPLRVVLLGASGAGKTAVLNLLLGQNMVPDRVDGMPSVKLEFGVEPKMLCTLPDGSKKIIGGIDFEACASLKPAFVTVQANLPALAKISVMEVVAPDIPEQQQKAVSWACKQADVVIWCSTDFTEDEQDIWDVVPGRLKDHGFLLLTKTDQLMGQAEINTRLATLSQNCGDEFLRILPISAKLALEARGTGQNINLNLFKSSGATGLISAIKGQIEEAQRATTDNAEQILARYCRDCDFQESKTVVDTPSQVSEPVPEDISVKADTSEHEQTNTTPHMAEVPPVEAPAEPERPRTAAAPKLEVVGPSYTDKSADKDKVLLEEALAVLSVYERDLVASLDHPEPWDDDQALQVCEEAIAMLPGVLEDGSSPALSDVIAGVYDAQDTLILMQHEQSESVADDALTLLLQVRRDIESMLARAA
ncbi:hypothetical protein [Profundibacter sp.]|uniref:hypothetical protein n=1 Tax=Profundibacter sp. TaxID=3101071 RepID=UPI003D0E1F6A